MRRTDLLERLVVSLLTGMTICAAPRALADDWPASTVAPPPKGFQMVKIPGGCYDMGDSRNGGEENERPSHRACVADFLIGKYPVSQSEWIQVMGKNPSAYGNCGGSCPVENVSWKNISEFLQRLNARGGARYRLPTEAEWEYAARSGGKAETWAGTSEPAELVGYAWFLENAALQPHPVGKKRPNGLGLYDMSGNVWQWMSDWYSPDYYMSSPEQNPTGPASGSLRVLRGGYWGDPAEMMRTTRRIALPPDARGPGYGLRLVQIAS